MILADKIIMERKKCGWSQEELAEKLEVTRQSVSKWESAQATPDIQRILVMSQLFGVTTDYLLKEDMETEEYTENIEMRDNNLRKVTLKEAGEFLEISKQNAVRISFGVLLCVMSPVVLLFLLALREGNLILLSEDSITGLGLFVLILMIAIAVSLFVTSGIKNNQFAFLESEVIDTEYGVIGMVKERKKQYESTYTKSVILGVVLCVLGVVPIFIGVMLGGSDMIMIMMVSALMMIEAIGVHMLVHSGVIQSSFHKLLQENEYRKEIKMDEFGKTISAIYWTLVTAVFLGYSFLTNDWGRSWIIWPVTAVLFPAFQGIAKLLHKSSEI